VTAFSIVAYSSAGFNPQRPIPIRSQGSPNSLQNTRSSLLFGHFSFHSLSAATSYGGIGMSLTPCFVFGSNHRCFSWLIQ
jgi:hypothetical protein